VVAIQQHLVAAASADQLMAELLIARGGIASPGHKDQQQTSDRKLAPDPQKRTVEKARRR
jgi:hypothetical protein